MKEIRIFLELMKMPDGSVSISVGGGSLNKGLMEEHCDLTSAIKDIEKRANIDYEKLREDE